MNTPESSNLVPAVPMHPMQDDRTEAQCLTHICFIKGRDTFLSGWGGAEGGTSYAVWSCKPEHLDTVYEWVKGRDDMVGVTAAFNPDTFHLLRGDRLHIYVVNDGHPCLNLES